MVALVTGGNKGIGWEVCRQLAAHGHTVWLGARNHVKAVAAADKIKLAHPGAEVIPLLLDVLDRDSMWQAMQQVAQAGHSLQVLVNNAGVLLPSDKSPLQVSPEVVKTTLETNALGPWWMMQVFLSLLPAGARIIQVSSGGGQITNGQVATWAPAYCVSKTLVNAITLQWAAADASRHYYAVDPGWTQTDMGGQNAPLSVQEGADTIVWLAMEPRAPASGVFYRQREPVAW